mmetsp:Transcript_25777/g.48027  ORF Transcript_25777/g.48027 Transcript_25777/m.48027 type:complete len:141 (+) Transcript_25777:408-830(+)
MYRVPQNNENVHNAKAAQNAIVDADVPPSCSEAAVHAPIASLSIAKANSNASTRPNMFPEQSFCINRVEFTQTIEPPIARIAVSKQIKKKCPCAVLIPNQAAAITVKPIVHAFCNVLGFAMSVPQFARTGPMMHPIPMQE